MTLPDAKKDKLWLILFVTVTPAAVLFALLVQWKLQQPHVDQLERTVRNQNQRISQLEQSLALARTRAGVAPQTSSKQSLSQLTGLDTSLLEPPSVDVPVPDIRAPEVSVPPVGGSTGGEAQSTAAGETGDARPANTVTFENESGLPALVKLVGPTETTVNVADGGQATVNAAPGRYVIKVRYGQSGKYRYMQGDPFEITQTATSYSKIRITLHTVSGGKYGMSPIGEDEF